MSGTQNYSHEEHVAAGLKGAIANPKVSVEAKEHAIERLEEITEQEMHNAEVHDHRVIGGYKATLKNPNASEPAKENAREKLEEYGVAHK